jgi:hypothetical protein
VGLQPLPIVAYLTELAIDRFRVKSDLAVGADQPVDPPLDVLTLDLLDGFSHGLVELLYRGYRLVERSRFQTRVRLPSLKVSREWCGVTGNAIGGISRGLATRQMPKGRVNVVTNGSNLFGMIRPAKPMSGKDKIDHVLDPRNLGLFGIAKPLGPVSLCKVFRRNLFQPLAGFAR